MNQGDACRPDISQKKLKPFFGFNAINGLVLASLDLIRASSTAGYANASGFAIICSDGFAVS